MRLSDIVEAQPVPVAPTAARRARLSSARPAALRARSARPAHPRPHPRGLRRADLAPSRRGRGCGPALLGYVDRAARDRGLAAVRLRVFTENPAWAWYARLGYRVVAAEAHSAILENRLLA
ncbi:MAG TPA: GNAT family N-acetyltransferase [Thermomicrobiales bacterium]|nr:GNAT family N-acetyltransferase [Thermomicrobiales bacterium]